jgi:hypothetical protein
MPNLHKVRDDVRLYRFGLDSKRSEQQRTQNVGGECYSSQA